MIPTTHSEQDSQWFSIEAAIEHDDGAAAKEHLAAGQEITYRDPLLGNALIREWPDGRREVIKADLEGNITVIRSL